jgi:hypothetical protein
MTAAELLAVNELANGVRQRYGEWRVFWVFEKGGVVMRWA